ncbi:MAG: GntR family transcriptional regulator [Dermatophilaceae bacterium]
MSTQPPPSSLPAIGVTHRSLREQVADAIRERIATGELPPGTWLVERTLAAELQVSRVPVRDALHLLKGEGFVTEVPGRGVIVTRLSGTDVTELFDVREALEVLTVRLATQHADATEVARLKERLDASAEAIQAEDSAAIGRCNQDFHDAITAMAHNELLASLLEPLEGRLHWLLRQNTDPHLLHEEHVALYEAIAAGDPEAAARSSLSHVQTSRTICLDLLDAHPPT